MASDRVWFTSQNKFFTSQRQTHVTVTWTKNSPRLTSTKFSRPWFSQNRRQNFGTGAAEKKLLSFKIPIHDFHELNTVFHLSPKRCKYRHRCSYNYRRRSTTKIKVFASVEKFSQNFAVNSPPKNKCRFAISHEQNNLFHLNFTSCKHRHRYYIGIIQIFERMRIF